MNQLAFDLIAWSKEWKACRHCKGTGVSRFGNWQCPACLGKMGYWVARVGRVDVRPCSQERGQRKRNDDR